MRRVPPRLARLAALLCVVSLLPWPAARAADAGLAPTGLVAYLDRANDLWVSQDNGEGRTRLTTGGNVRDVVWAPDGARLAFVDAGGLVALASPDPAFGPRGLHAGGGIHWAPDGSLLAFIDGGTVHIFNRDGAYERSIPVGADSIRWSPDGQRIAFTRFLGDPYRAGCATREIGWIDAWDGASHIAGRSFGKYTWAGDARRLLYASVDDGTVRGYDVVSGANRVVSTRSANPCGGPFFTSTDGRRLFFLDYGAGGKDLVSIDLSGASAARVYPGLPVGYPANTLPEAYVTVDAAGRFGYTVQTYPTTITRVDLGGGAQTPVLVNDYRMVLGFAPDHDRVALLATPYGQPSVTFIRDLASGAEVSFENVGWLAWQPSPITTATLAAWTGVWDREDRPVAASVAARTWIWGPAPFATRQEFYAQSPGAHRAVQYYDKSRMEVSNPHGDRGTRWYVTNGLLVRELITGELQVGDAAFVTRNPAAAPVAGDPDDASGPTYAALGGLLGAAPVASGSEIRASVDRTGQVGAAGPGGVRAAEHVAETNHTIADVFWDYLNSDGKVWDGQAFVDGKLFDPTFFATGFPITEAYWAKVKVGGKVKDVLVQCFERRCLTYTPDNPDGWKVEMGNVGRHYYAWRYGS